MVVPLSGISLSRTGPPRPVVIGSIYQIAAEIFIGDEALGQSLLTRVGILS
ncbi:hypothetical protein RIEGSTA812A_PEG_801 [invertebrate metagenome]|uniref:Uncharacterized protein n=1 Tax=invertebrate metagenome TaxID=1711999 RepID=A0A484HB07_9ZZZZ